MQEFYTVLEVSKRLNVSTQTIYNLIDSKELVVYEFGQTIRIKESDLQTYLNKEG